MSLFKTIATTTLLLGLTTIALAGGGGDYQIMLTNEQMAQRLDKYDTLKFVNYSKTYDEKTGQFHYEFPNEFVLFNNKVELLRLELGMHYTDEADWHLWRARHDPDQVNIITNSDKEKMIILISTIVDDRKKAEELFEELHSAYLEEYEEYKTLPECQKYCRISATVEYENKGIRLRGTINERGPLTNIPENRHSIDIFFLGDYRY